MNTRNRKNEAEEGGGEEMKKEKKEKGSNKNRGKKETNLFHSLEVPKGFFLFCSTSLNETHARIQPPQA
jgi:hypothetical protein